MDNKNTGSDEKLMQMVETERTFTTWASKVTGPNGIAMDHTWVQSINPNDNFCCFGSTNPVRELFSVIAGNNAYTRANICRRNADGCYLSYGINGVCHQAANRFLLHVGTSIRVQANKPTAYDWSSAVYGDLGHGYNFKRFRKLYYDPSWEKYPDSKTENESLQNIFAPESLEGRILQLYLSAEETNTQDNDIIVKSTSLVLADKLQGYQSELFETNQMEILRRKAEILKAAGFEENDEYTFNLPKISAIDVRSVFGKVNKLAIELQSVLKETIGADNYKIYNNGDDTIYNIVDVNLAAEIYAK